jgi:hypothetical protein
MFRSVAIGALAALAVAATAGEPETRPAMNPALSADDDAMVNALVTACMAQRDQRIKGTEARLKRLQEAPQPTGGAEYQQRARELKETRASLKDLRDKHKPFLPLLPPSRDWSVGSIGVPPNTEWRVDQVLSENELLVTFTYWETFAGGVDGGIPVQKPFTSRVYWLKGYAASGLVTGTQIDMSRTVLYVKEAKTYGTTSGGSNTTFVLEVVPERIVAEFNRTFAERSRGKH